MLGYEPMKGPRNDTVVSRSRRHRRGHGRTLARQAYRSASTVLGDGLPPICLVAIADINEAFATQTANRYGFERAEPSWQAIADAPDIEAVSIVVGNFLHREIAEALLAAGKHVLCEKPLAPSVEDARAMVAAAEEADRVASTGFSYRRSPAVSAIREQIIGGNLGEVLHFGEFLCGPITSVAGSQLPILIADRPKPLGAAVGHAAGVAVSDEREAVTNEDIATFTARFANGAAGTFSVSLVDRREVRAGRTLRRPRRCRRRTTRLRPAPRLPSAP